MVRRMALRIAVIASYAPSLLNFRGELLKSMVQRGHTVYAFAPADSPGIAEARNSLSEIGVGLVTYTLSRRGLTPWRDCLTILELTRLLRENSIDCVLSYTAKPVVYGSIAARRAGVPGIFSIITGLGFAFSTDTLLARLVRRVNIYLYKISIKHNRRVFFQNPDDWQLFIDYNILTSKDKGVLVNGSGVDLDRFAPEPLPKNLTFLLIGRLIAEKGIREYVEAARHVKRRYPNVRFLLVGGFETGAHQITRAEVERWVDEGTVEYLGTLSDVRVALKECTVFVLPTYYREGQPRTILEAMAVGRPIITTDNPGSRETVENGVNGFLVPPKDVVSLVEAMMTFVEKPEIAESMGKASRRIAEHKYDVHKINHQMLQVMGL